MNIYLLLILLILYIENLLRNEKFIFFSKNKKQQ